MGATSPNPDKKPSPYMMNPRTCIMTCGDDRYGKYGSWISIANEWVRLPDDEVNRLMKKYHQAKEIRLQWEAESGMKQDH